VKRRHTSTATSILTTKSTSRSLRPPRLSERTVLRFRITFLHLISQPTSETLIAKTEKMCKSQTWISLITLRPKTFTFVDDMFYLINKVALLHHSLYRHWHKTAVCSVSSLLSTSPNFHRSKRIERYRFWLKCRDRQVRITAKLRNHLSKGLRSFLSTLKQMPKEHLQSVNKFLSIQFSVHLPKLSYHSTACR
jgi:hypothetical protein